MNTPAPHDPTAYAALRQQYGDVAITVMNACAQHRTGRTYDPWDWRTVLDVDIEMARGILGLLR